MANCKKTDMFIGAIKSSAAKPVKKAVGGDMSGMSSRLSEMAARKAMLDKRSADRAAMVADRTATINKRVFDRTGKTAEDLAAEKAAAAAKVKQRIMARDPNAPTAMQRVEKLYMNAPRAYNPDEDQARRTRMDNYKQHYTDSIAKLEAMRAAKSERNAMTPTKKAAGGAGKTRKGMMK